MYSIALGSLTLEFGAALIEVPCNGSYDWLNEDWDEIPQEIQIVQGDTSAIVTGLTGRFAEKGPHWVEVISPCIFCECDVVEHLLSKPDTSGQSESEIRDALRTANFPWGKLVSLNWGSLGYAPGGTEYCLLPSSSPAISLGFLRLDWASVRVNRLTTAMPAPCVTCGSVEPPPSNAQ
jgi:hypothetical protein